MLDPERLRADLAAKADRMKGPLWDGVRGVPVIFLNGRPVKGAQPIETYRQIISEELTKPAK